MKASFPDSGVVSKAMLLISVVLVLLVGPILADSQDCDRELPQGKGPDDYRDRGDRCEGLYARKVSGSGKTVHLLSFSAATPIFDPKHDDLAILRWQVLPGSAPVHVRAQSLAESKLFYRMDALPVASSSEFRWKTLLLRKLGLQASEVGVYAWASHEIGGVSEIVLLPIHFSKEVATDGYKILLMLERGVSSLRVSVYKTSPQGGFGPLQSSKGLKAEALRPQLTLPSIVLPFPAAAGLYILQAKANENTTEEISETWFFFHPGKVSASR
jgi:hypothetical protein